MRLTDTRVKTLEPPPKGFKIYLDEEPKGFGVRVTARGVRAFVLTYGKDRERLTIGQYPTISLSDARTEAKRFLAERTLGKHRPTRMRAEEALARFLAEQQEKNRPLTVKYTEANIRNHFPKLLRKNLEDVRTDDVTDVTDKLLKKKLPGAANHAFTAIRTFLRWCVKRRYIPHSPIEGLDLPSKAGSRERVLSDDELRTIWKAADEIGGCIGGIVKLLILTGQRRTEIASLRREWTDCEVNTVLSAKVLPHHVDTTQLAAHRAQCTITLPKTITKNKKEHSFPTGLLAATLLNSLNADGLFFPARGSTSKPFNGWSKAKTQIDKRTPGLAPWTLHDLRRTYCTNLQRLGIRYEVIEALVNHISGSRAGVAGIYQRHSWWSEMVEAVATYEAWFKRTILQVRNDEELTSSIPQS